MVKETLLLVQTDQTIFGGLLSQMEAWGYHVVAADHLSQVRDLLLVADPTLLLLVFSPMDTTARELFSEIQALRPETPIIILAGSGMTEEAIRCLSAGAYEMVSLELPYRFEILRHIIANALKHVQLRSQCESASQSAAPATSAAPVSPRLAELAHGFPIAGIALYEVEKDLIEQAMRATGWNKSKAARLLHITRDTLRYKVKKYHLVSQPEARIIHV
ncbi:MAG: hypothetical protein HYR55_20515 [Acidobacteria bacterium]|nr:hypothetical protein [Acidobacteriota bacterium]MBI3658616.1 hypothetical protein [Acidobacteriota bacterium]